MPEIWLERCRAFGQHMALLLSYNKFREKLSLSRDNDRLIRGKIKIVRGLFAFLDDPVLPENTRAMDNSTAKDGSRRSSISGDGIWIYALCHGLFSFATLRPAETNIPHGAGQPPG